MWRNWEGQICILATGTAVKQCMEKTEDRGSCPGFPGGTLIPVWIIETLGECYWTVRKHGLRLHTHVLLSAWRANTYDTGSSQETLDARQLWKNVSQELKKKNGIRMPPQSKSIHLVPKDQHTQNTDQWAVTHFHHPQASLWSLTKKKKKKICTWFHQFPTLLMKRLDYDATQSPK